MDLHVVIQGRGKLLAQEEQRTGFSRPIGGLIAFRVVGSSVLGRLVCSETTVVQMQDHGNQKMGTVFL